MPPFLFVNSCFFSIDNCPEVRVLDLKSQCSVNVFNCPTVYMSGKSWELMI